MRKQSGKPAPWGEAHRREAHRALYREAAERSPSDAAWMTGDPGASFSEKRFRDALTSVGKPDPARVDREVRRVRALAEGRLVRDVVWRAVNYDGDADATFEGADAERECREWCEIQGFDAVRVTRIRRASR